MPRYRFELQVNRTRAAVDDVVTDAETFGATSTTTPSLTLLSLDKFRYQVVISNLKEEDASYLVLKHDLIVVRTELYYD